MCLAGEEEEKSFEFHFTFFGENRIIRLLQVILTGVNEKKAILFFDIFQKYRRNFGNKRLWS